MDLVDSCVALMDLAESFAPLVGVLTLIVLANGSVTTLADLDLPGLVSEGTTRNRVPGVSDAPVLDLEPSLELEAVRTLGDGREDPLLDLKPSLDAEGCRTPRSDLEEGVPSVSLVVPGRWWERWRRRSP